MRCLLAAVTAVALVLSACAPDAPSTTADPTTSPTVGEDSPTRDPSARALRVVATLAPIADLVMRVGDDQVDVTSMVPSGADAHTYEPRPSDVVALAEADLYIGIGLSLNDGALRLARENLREGAPLVLLGEVALADDDLMFDHAHDGHGGHGHSHEDNGHRHSHGDADDEPGPNPHVWTSLRNTASLVRGIADALSSVDPDHSDIYRERAADYIADLEALDDRISSAIATIPDDSRMLVVYHDAWAYFARDHGLDMITAVQPADFSEPSASEVRAIIDLIRRLDVQVVFGSEVFPTPVLEAIAEETGARYIADLSDDVLPATPGSAEHSYLELMRRNARAIVDGLGGDPSLLDS